MEDNQNTKINIKDFLVTHISEENITTLRELYDNKKFYCNNGWLNNPDIFHAKDRDNYRKMHQDVYRISFCDDSVCAGTYELRWGYAKKNILIDIVMQVAGEYEVRCYTEKDEHRYDVYIGTSLPADVAPFFLRRISNLVLKEREKCLGNNNAETATKEIIARLNKDKGELLEKVIKLEEKNKCLEEKLQKYEKGIPDALLYGPNAATIEKHLSK